MTFYFYDLETTGVNSRSGRIMQFAGQRTDMNLKPVAEPDNFLIKLTADVLPDLDAILITGITPQATLTDGISEAEFLKYFNQSISTPNTTFVGFNNVRFDDEFMCFLMWRNFNDPYEWQWKDGCSRWDILDLSRITRALRPKGIEWPFAPDGKPTNRLEYLTSVNKLDHDGAHDALSDVMATIAVARLIMNKQPKLFEYMLSMRDKNKVQALVTKAQPLIYCSGRYPSEYQKTTVAVMVAAHPTKKAALMYDLRINPDDFTNLTSQQLAALWQLREKDSPYFPVKELAYNKCPAVAPLSTLDAESAERLKIDLETIKSNYQKLIKSKDFGDKLVTAQKSMYESMQQELVTDEQRVDSQLYDSFVNDSDRTKMSVVRAADANELASLNLDFADERLRVLLPLYRARNYPKSLNQSEQQNWEQFRVKKLFDGGSGSVAARYFKRIEELAQDSKLNDQQRYLLEELKLYGESILPEQ